MHRVAGDRRLGRWWVLNRDRDPGVFEASVDDSIIAECPDCFAPMLLGKYWRELIVEDQIYDVMLCPDCEDDDGDSWSEDADPVITGFEDNILRGDRIEL